LVKWLVNNHLNLMIKVPIVSDKLFNSLKRGEIKLSHAPNRSLCWSAKNLVGTVKWFEFGNNNGMPPKSVVRFSRSSSL